MYVEIVEAVPGDAGRDDPLVLTERCDMGSVSAGGEAFAPQMTYQDVINLAPTLKANGIKIALAIQAHKLGNSTKMNAIANVINAMGAANVYPWLVLSWCDGYFVNDTNYNTFATAANSLDTWWRITKGYAPTTFIVDEELRWARSRQFSGATATNKITLMQNWTNTTNYNNARTALANLVTNFKNKGWAVQGTTAAVALDDFYDGDEGIMKGWGTPITGISWSRISWQAYRTIFMAQCAPLTVMSNFFVYDYLNTAKNLPWSTKFPNTTLGVDIGLTEPGPVFPEGLDYLDVFLTQGVAKELSLDVEAANSAGQTNTSIGVYDLQGAACKVNSNGTSVTCSVSNITSLIAPRIGQSAPLPDTCTPTIHTAMHVLDAAL